MHPLITARYCGIIPDTGAARAHLFTFKVDEQFCALLVNPDALLLQPRALFQSYELTGIELTPEQDHPERCFATRAHPAYPELAGLPIFRHSATASTTLKAKWIPEPYEITEADYEFDSEAPTQTLDS